MSRLLEVQSLEAGYGAFKVLRGVSLHVDIGENVGLFGPNGHGKTTLFETLSGLIRPTAGRVVFDGADITAAPPAEIVERGLIHVSQGNLLFGHMTVGETLALAAFARRARAIQARNRDFVLNLFPRLAERSHQQCRTLSGGERQMLNIGAGLMANPRLMILDEPTLGLSPKLKEVLAYAIKSVADSGVQLLVVEQDVDFLLLLCSRLYLVNHGEIAKTVNVADGGLVYEQIMEDYFGVRSP
jgi:branched-chain amino acid transport system ATP-binding protein